MLKSSGIFSHQNNTDEQTVFTFQATVDDSLVWGIWLDLSSLSQNTTIRYKYQIDGINSRAFRTTSFNATTSDDGVLFGGIFGITEDYYLIVTLQSSVLEGAVRSIPYSIYYHSILSTPLAKSTGVYSHANGTSEDTAVTLTPATGQYYVNWGLWLDLYTLTQNTTVRAKHKIDGTTYRTFSTLLWVALTSDDGVLIEGEFATEQPITVTMQSAIAEGRTRNIPYVWFYYSQEEPDYFMMVDRADFSIKGFVGNQSMEPIEFQLVTDGDPIDLTYINHIEIYTADRRGTRRLYTSAGGSPLITATDAENGKIRLTPTSTSFLDYLSPYKVWIWVYDTSTYKYVLPENGSVIMTVRAS